MCAPGRVIYHRELMHSFNDMTNMNLSFDTIVNGNDAESSQYMFTFSGIFFFCLINKNLLKNYRADQESVSQKQSCFTVTVIAIIVKNRMSASSSKAVLPDAFLFAQMILGKILDHFFSSAEADKFL